MKKNNHETLIILGILPYLAAAGKLYSALWLALVFVVITVIAALCANLTRNVICGKARLIADAAVCAALTTAAVLIFRAVLPKVEAGMGFCLSLTAVNWLIYGVCETSAKNGFKASVKNAAAYALAGAGLLLVTAALRELLSAGTLFGGFRGGEGIRIFGDWFSSLKFAETSAGALIILAFVGALLQKIGKNIRITARERRIRRDTIASGSHPDLVVDEETGKIVRRSTEELLMKHRAELAASAENSEEIKAFAEEELSFLGENESNAENDDTEAET